MFSFFFVLFLRNNLPLFSEILLYNSYSFLGSSNFIVPFDFTTWWSPVPFTPTYGASSISFTYCSYLRIGSDVFITCYQNWRASSVNGPTKNPLETTPHCPESTWDQYIGPPLLWLPLGIWQLQLQICSKLICFYCIFNWR